MSGLERETRALARIAAKQQQHGLRRVAQRQAAALARGGPQRLRFGAASKSLPRLHAEEAEQGVRHESLRWRGAS